MNPLQQLIDFISQLQTQANATLASLPPIEQFEASQELSYAFRSLRSQANNLAEFAKNATTSVTELVGKLNTNATAEARAALLKDGAFVSKADHEAAISAAAIAKETEVKAAATAEAGRVATVLQRRKLLVDEKVLPAVAAERMPDTALTAEDFRAKALLVGVRLKSLSELGVTAEKAPSVIGDVAALPLDPEGDAAFTLRLKFCEEAAASASKAPPAKPGITNPLLGSGAADAVPQNAEGYRANLL